MKDVKDGAGGEGEHLKKGKKERTAVSDRAREKKKKAAIPNMIRDHSKLFVAVTPTAARSVVVRSLNAETVFFIFLW
jgi:hypothetical protein